MTCCSCSSSGAIVETLGIEAAADGRRRRGSRRLAAVIAARCSWRSLGCSRCLCMWRPATTRRATMLRSGFAHERNATASAASRGSPGIEATIVHAAAPGRSRRHIVVTAQSPFGSADPPQSMTAILERNRVGACVRRGRMAGGFGSSRRARRWWIGFNQLQLVFSSTVSSPRDVGAGDDTRQLALRGQPRIDVTPRKE